MWHHKSSPLVNAVSSSRIFQTILNSHSIVSWYAWMKPGSLIQQVNQQSNQLVFPGWTPGGFWGLDSPFQLASPYLFPQLWDLWAPFSSSTENLLYLFPYGGSWGELRGEAKITHVYFTGSAVHIRAGWPSLFLNQNDSVTFYSKSLFLL